MLKKVVPIIALASLVLVFAMGTLVADNTTTAKKDDKTTTTVTCSKDKCVCPEGCNGGEECKCGGKCAHQTSADAGCAKTCATPCAAHKGATEARKASVKTTEPDCAKTCVAGKAACCSKGKRP